ncbi:DUF4184 family protein [Streptomyces poonensis]|uniref:DUF4184 family protein n=1 Tax=Streptomyces poonensis TaxID=68255 RepID=A0A918Q200_9ACTN|nr:DUF4184 family protein [Streptomyces poonensis]GGZ31004.1 hypothetical protein GCM10010365_59430 [Streptomyces poonensis]GLJ88268.1 hypothetical protein GCM10017589_08680 [Streptomyces poonensis]
MPFTLSHAAAVLPAVRRDGTGRGPLLPSLLVTGSMAPDMTYYAASVLPGAMEFGDFTHSLTGVLTFDVLVACALTGAWLFLREPLVALLPRGRQGRIASLVRCGAPRRPPRPATALWWYVSALLGALTHVVWDAFTHHDRWGTQLFPVIGQEVAGQPLYWYLQYGSSAVAAVVLAVFLGLALRRQPPVPPVGVPALSVADRWVAGAVIGACAVAAAVHRVHRWWSYWGSTAKPYEVIPTLCFGAGAGLVLGLALYGAGVRMWRRSAPVPPGPRAPRPDAEPVPR